MLIVMSYVNIVHGLTVTRLPSTGRHVVEYPMYIFFFSIVQILRLVLFIITRKSLQGSLYWLRILNYIEIDVSAAIHFQIPNTQNGKMTTGYRITRGAWLMISGRHIRCTEAS